MSGTGEEKPDESNKLTPGLAAYIRARRQAKGFKQRRMAELVGLTSGGYAYLESGKASSSSALPKVLELLEIDPGAIAGIAIGATPQAARTALSGVPTAVPEAAISPCKTEITQLNGWLLAAPLGRWAAGEVLLTQSVAGPQDWSGGDELLIWHADSRVELCKGVTDRNGMLTVLRGDQATQIVSALVKRSEKLIGALIA
jgi:transcriptional regulator with XRE-family HTH domain